MIEHYNNDVLPRICEYEDILLRQGPKAAPEVQKKEFYAIMSFEQPIISTPIGSLIIGSKLDADISAKNCRLAFYGRIVKILKKDEGLEQFKIAKPK